MTPTKKYSWKQSIINVLEEVKIPLSCHEITNIILEKKLRVNPGQTPVRTVSAQITTSINKKETIFYRIKPNVYTLVQYQENQNSDNESQETNIPLITEDGRSKTILEACGLRWARDHIIWNAANTQMFGVEVKGATPFNFANKQGIYALYDGPELVYIGRTSNKSGGFAVRLSSHTNSDKLAKRWDKFSWFAIQPPKTADETDDTIIGTEALLIEILRPRLNDRGGDYIRGVEYQQFETKEAEEKRFSPIVNAARSHIASAINPHN